MSAPPIPTESAPLTPAEIAGLEQAMLECEPYAEPFKGTVFRFASVDRANRTDLLSGIGSSRYGQRWNPRGIRTAYTALDEITAISESLEEKRANGLPISMATPSVFTAIETSFNRVLDLTSPVVQAVLDPLGFTNERMVNEPWRKRIESNGAERGLTIEIGRIAHGLGLQGLIVPSKPRPGGKNLAIYRDRCPDDSLKIVNADRLPPARDREIRQSAHPQ